MFFLFRKVVDIYYQRFEAVRRHLSASLTRRDGDGGLGTKSCGRIRCGKNLKTVAGWMELTASWAAKLGVRCVWVGGWGYRQGTHTSPYPPTHMTWQLVMPGHKARSALQLRFGFPSPGISKETTQKNQENTTKHLSGWQIEKANNGKLTAETRSGRGFQHWKKNVCE